MKIPLRDIPIEVRRVASQHLESLRDSEMMKEMQGSHLDDVAVALLRPDIDGIAYYEFAIVAGKGSRQVMHTSNFEAVPASVAAKKTRKTQAEEVDRARADRGAPIGFIVASNGRHDFPVTHWSLDRLPPSLQASTDTSSDCDDAKDRTRGEPARFYKLDTLAYAAEDANGMLVGSSGQMPALLSGLPHSLARHAGIIATSSARPSQAQDNDDLAEQGKHELQRSDHTPPKLSAEVEGDWKTFKSRYADAFGPLLDHLRSRAAKTWEIEDAISKFGEGIFTGTRHRVALLDAAAIELRGEGAKFIESRVEENPVGPPSLLLHALPGSLQKEADFEVALSYRNGEHERLRFFVVSSDTPSNSRAEKSKARHPDCED